MFQLRPNAVSTDEGAFYASPPVGVTANGNPYAQTNFDNSPLDRAVEQGAPGAAWQLSNSGVPGSGHTVKMVYTLNNATAFSSDSINGRQAAMYYTVINSDMSQTLYAGGYYNANTLTVTISKDENWQSGRAGTVEEYKDIDGHVVLKRVYNYAVGAVQMLSTYYVYDDLGRLAFVLPPSSGADGDGTISSTTLNNLCYQYQYDERGRPMAKKLPGKGWEYTVFNTMDQPVATQDANQQAQNEWIFTKYDGQQRPVMTGIWNNGNVAITRASLQTILTGITTNLYEASTTTGNGYTNVAWPTSSVTATLNLNYYDNYNAPGLPGIYSAPTTANLGTRGELTASLTAVLNTPANQLWKVNYYDNWGRSTKAYAQHYLGGVLSSSNYDAVTTTYNFTNAPTTVTRQHWNTASTAYPLVTIANSYIYDHMGRKLKSWEQITNGNSSPTTKTLLSQTLYNEVGQVIDKQLHSTDSVTFYQNIAYNYNERGWLNGSNAPLFAMQLLYNTSPTGKQYNGNIAYQSWVNPTLSDNYTYTYDKLNRLMSGTAADSYTENNISYDVMGNISSLNRYQNGTLIDQLAYSYTNAGNQTNQLQTISDNSGSNIGIKAGTGLAYVYDPNGNVTTDPSRYTGSINIGYNLLNLPQSISGGKTITYTYDATGNKLRRVSTGTGNTDYINGVEYDGGALTFIQTEEGKVIPNGSSYTYYYYLGDNLGNTRVTFTNGGYTQVDDYYPFGMEMSRYANGTKNEYLYNRKELQEELGVYDYGARFYDPVTGRWGVVDAYAEHPDQIDLSPYVYVGDNPVDHTDPDGNCPNCITAVIGAGIGAVFGAVVEGGSQLYNSGHITSWSAVGGSALQGAITGGVAGFTGGASLLVTAGASAAANVVGGAANNAIQGRAITAKSVATDAVIGAGLGVAGKLAGSAVSKGLNKLSNSAKGELGEAVTKIKYAAGGYISDGKAVVPTGGTTPTGRVQVAVYDHAMENIFTGKQLTVESKFNTSGLTGNQAAARSNVATPGGLIVDRTTSGQLGNVVQSVVTGSSGQIKKQ